jgi:hypothetical protein
VDRFCGGDLSDCEYDCPEYEQGDQYNFDLISGAEVLLWAKIMVAESATADVYQLVSEQRDNALRDITLGVMLYYI